MVVGLFLVSDEGSDHFLVATNGRDKVSARSEFVAEEIPNLALTFCASMIQVTMIL